MNLCLLNICLELMCASSCLVYDMGSRSNSGLPSSFWKGLEFVRFALRHYLLEKTSDAYFRGRKVTDLFAHTTRKFSENTKQQLRYYKRFVQSGMEDVQLYGFFKRSQHDGEYDFYASLAEQYCGPNEQTDRTTHTVNEDHLWESESNSRVFWQRRGYLMYAGGVCCSVHDRLLGDDSLSDIDWTKCSFPRQSFKNNVNTNCSR